MDNNEWLFGTIYNKRERHFETNFSLSIRFEKASYFFLNFQTPSIESFNPLLKDLKSLFDSERNLYDSPSNFCPEIVVLRFGQINLESKTLLPLLIISEPLPITPSNSVSSSVSFVEPKKENSIPQLPNKSIEPVTTSNLNVKEVLFGNTSSPPRVPLFPKEPEVINEEKKTNSETANPSNSTPSKSTAAYFFQKLRSPEAADIVRYING